MATDGPTLLRTYLYDLRITGKEFAQSLGVSPEQLSRYLTGRMVPPRTTALAIEYLTNQRVKTRDWKKQ